MTEYDQHLTDNVRQFRARKPNVVNVPLTDLSYRSAVVFKSPSVYGKIISIDVLRRNKEIADAIAKMRRDRIAGDSIYRKLTVLKEEGKL